MGAGKQLTGVDAGRKGVVHSAIINAFRTAGPPACCSDAGPQRPSPSTQCGTRCWRHRTGYCSWFLPSAECICLRDDDLEHLVHLLVAFLLALPIGWNGAREEQGAGIRTFPLVAMASCGLVHTAVSVLGTNATTQANILQGVIAGIGSIGAGAVFRSYLSGSILCRVHQIDVKRRCHKEALRG